MRCPFCGNDDAQVKDSRPTEDNSTIRRRRLCSGCGARFTTFERVQLRELSVIKSGGQRELFDREKLLRSMRIAFRKRPIDADGIDRVVNSLIRQLEACGESDILARLAGESPERRAVREKAEALLRLHAADGAPRGACVQAVKTGRTALQGQAPAEPRRTGGLNIHTRGGALVLGDTTYHLSSMCGRLTIHSSPDLVAQRFGIAEPLPDLGPRYNAVPLQQLPVVR